MKMCEMTWAEAMRQTDLGVFNGLWGSLAGGGSGSGPGAGAGANPGVPTPIWGAAKICVDGSDCITQWFIIGWEWPAGNQVV